MQKGVQPYSVTYEINEIKFLETQLTKHILRKLSFPQNHIQS